MPAPSSACVTPLPTPSPAALPVPAPTPPSAETQVSAPGRSAAGAEATGLVLAVTGACGGLGVSCLAVQLARALVVQGRSVSLVDMDPTGGVGHLLAHGLRGGLRWGDLPDHETRFRPHALAGAMPVWRGVRVLTADERGGPREGSADLRQAVATAMAQVSDVVVLDLPRAQQPPPGSLAMVLTSYDLRAASAAQVLVPWLRRTSDDVGLVVREEGQDTDASYLTWATGCPVLGYVRTDRGLAQRAARGEDVTRGRGASRRAVRALAEVVIDLLDSRLQQAQAGRARRGQGDKEGDGAGAQRREA